MTDTAKPTSFSLELSAELQKEIAEYANLIPLEPISAELIDVYTKTGLTPRQLLEQRDDAINRLQNSTVANTTLIKRVEKLTEQRDELIKLIYGVFCEAITSDGVSIPTVYRMRAALANYGKVGG